MNTSTIYFRHFIQNTYWPIISYLVLSFFLKMDLTNTVSGSSEYLLFSMSFIKML